MIDPKVQQEVVQLRAEVNVPSEGIYDGAQKMGYLSTSVKDTGKSINETSDMFNKLRSELFLVTGMLGFSFPQAISASAVAMAALNVSERAAQLRQYEKVMTGSTLASDEWVKKSEDSVLRLAIANGMLTGEVQKRILLLGQHRIPQEQLLGAFDAMRLAMWELATDSDTATQIVSFALARQGKSINQAELDVEKYRLLAKDMGVPAKEFANALAQLEQQLPTESIKMRPESLIPFLKEFHEAGLPMLETIVGAPFQRQLLWENLPGVGITEEDIQQSPERAMLKMMQFAEQSTHSLQGYPKERRMAIESLLRGVFGFSTEEGKFLAEEFEKEIDSNIPWQQMVDALPRKVQEKAIEGAQRLPQAKAKSQREGKDILGAGSRLVQDYFWYQLGKEWNQRSWQEKSQFLVGSLIPGVTPLLLSRYGFPGVADVATNLVKNFTESDSLKASMVPSHIVRGAPVSGVSASSAVDRLTSQSQLQGIPAHTPIQQQQSKADINLRIEITGDAARQARVQRVAVPQLPGLNIGVDIIENGVNNIGHLFGR
ncbi:MAG: hypothetical protein M1343_08485 [Chloroflexi bacterium]|nr:hypothetical protein [Chloroflexota bacterium]